MVVADLVALQAAAAEFHVGQTTIYRYLNAGRLKRYRRAMDTKTYVDRDELRGLLEPKPVRSTARAEKGKRS